MPNAKVTKTFTFNGKRYYAYGSTLDEALEKKIAMKKALESSAIAKGGSMTVREWSKIAYSTFKPNVSEEYMDQMKMRLEKHILPVIGSMSVNAVQYIHCQLILNNQAGMSNSHITKIRQELTFLFDTARRNQMIIKNPADDLIKPNGYTNKRRSLTDDERTHFLKCSDADPGYLLFLLMLYCGCRPAEAIEAEYADITEKAGVHFLHIRGTKTFNSDRIVPIPKELLSRLAPDGSGVIARNGSNRKHSESSYDRLTARLKRDMNISMGCTVYRNQLIPPFPLASDFVPYYFRHTYCTDLKKKGVDLRIAKDLMGHADIKTTANIYTHDDDETLMLAAKQMGLIEEDPDVNSTVVQHQVQH